MLRRVYELEAEKVRLEEELLAAARVIPPAGRSAPKEYFDDGVWFVVTWDGSYCGAAALGMKLAHLRGTRTGG